MKDTMKVTVDDLEYNVVVEQDEGTYAGRCIELPAAVSEANTIVELQENMVESISRTLEYMDQKKQ
jgi:predicted RNase H-like HicB family nuclease